MLALYSSAHENFNPEVNQTADYYQMLQDPDCMTDKQAPEY
jgi:hypothetical protein